MQTIAWFRQEVRGLFNFLLPPACALCLEPLTPPDPDSFCPSCLDKIPRLEKTCCPICALPHPDDAGSAHHCQACLLEKRSSFTGVVALGPHQDLLRDAVHRFKYRNDINLDRPLGNLLAAKVRDTGHAIDLIVPVPLHKRKLSKRGYNQSALIARQVSRTLELPTTNSLLSRTHQGAIQKEMRARDRTRNVRGLFTCSRNLHKENILLVDDVMTTGATARECSRTLLAAGASSVRVAILSRAPLK